MSKTESRKLIVPRFKNAEYERVIYQACPENGVSFEDVLQPEFWSHVADKLKPTDRIEVLAEDGSYFAELLVIDAGRLYAKVAVLRFVELASSEVPADLAGDLAEFKVEFKGPVLKHVVVRQSDKQYVQEGIARKADAEAWIREHVKALAR
jgi:hypothetical protein